MIVRAWRIVKAKYADEAFSGVGTKRFGGRWNSVGGAVVYVAGSQSLAILEMLVHLGAQDLLKHYVMFEVGFDEKVVTTVNVRSLPRGWKKSPASGAVQAIGDAWLAGGVSAALRVPSVIVPTEWNYLLNPAHRDFAKITIGSKQPARFDRRLAKRPN